MFLRKRGVNIMSDININSSFVVDVATELVNISKDLIVKREDLAQKYETLDSLTAYDIYATALSGTDTFSSYSSFTETVLATAGLSPDEIVLALLSTNNINENKRLDVLLAQRQYIIDTYEDKNNYYRVMCGLPYLEDDDYIYIQDTIQNVDTTKPIHLMTNDEILILNTLGYLDTIITNNPTKKYLKFLGINKISIITARTAKKFDILKYGYTSNMRLKQRFRMNYELSRTYILNNYYKRRLSIDQTYFDAYIGLLILVNAMIMTVNSSVDIFNCKESINDSTVHLILKSFNIDLFDDISPLYRKKVADNIQSLMVSKGTDEVIFKIFKIFGFNNIDVRKFMLIRDQKRDVNGDYIFSYEEDGVTPKYDEMYDLYFSQVDITTPNIDSAIREPGNKLGYIDVVSKDIYWGAYETADAVKSKILTNEFNYIDTDYININTAYALSKLTTEISYFMSMVINLKQYLEQLQFVEPFLGQTISIFYSIAMLSALVSKKIGFNGEIVVNPVDIATVYKFNFQRDLTVINNIMTKYGYSTNENFATILPQENFTDTEKLIDLFFDNKAILNRLRELRNTVKDLDDYLAIKELLDYITTGKRVAAAFTKPNNQIASTYLDYLTSINQVLAEYIDGVQVSELDTVITKLLNTLEEFIGSEKFDYLFIRIPTFSGENILKTYIQKIISVFKAFNISIFSMSVTYDIDDRSADNIKIIDRCAFEGNPHIHNNIPMVDTVGLCANMSQSTHFHISDDIFYYDKDGNRYSI